jgi:hypothetical protein
MFYWIHGHFRALYDYREKMRRELQIAYLSEAEFEERLDRRARTARF